MTVIPGRTLTLPVLPPPPDTFGWSGTLTQALQLAFGNVQDRVEDLIVFGVIADIPPAKGTATFFFAKDEGKLFFDGLDENGVAEWVWLGAEPVAMMQMVAAAGLDGETGFHGTNTDSAISIDANTRTVYIQPTGASYDVWCESTKYVKTEVESVVLSADVGSHAVVFNQFGVLTDLGTGFSIEDIIVDNSYVCEVYVNGGVIKWVADERHGLMPWQVHVQQHLGTGTVHRSGLGLINFNVDGNGSLNSHAEFDGASGLILDEDLTTTITAATSIPLLYRSGSSWDISTTFDPPIIQQIGSCCYNHYGASWELTAVPNNHFFLVHIFASPIKWVGATPTSGYVAILGQEEYLNVILARDGANQEISDIVTSGLPMAEFVPVGTVIYKANSGYANTYKCAVVSDADGDEYVSWLNTTIEAGLPPSAHPNLTHRDHADQHPAASITPVASSWTGVLSTSDTTVQAALDTLNGHNHDLLYAALSHTHDSRYYTETEVNSLLSGKSNTGHTHTESNITDLGDYMPLLVSTTSNEGSVPVYQKIYSTSLQYTRFNMKFWSGLYQRIYQQSGKLTVWNDGSSSAPSISFELNQPVGSTNPLAGWQFEVWWNSTTGLTEVWAKAANLHARMGIQAWSQYHWNIVPDILDAFEGSRTTTGPSATPEFTKQWDSTTATPDFLYDANGQKIQVKGKTALTTGAGQIAALTTVTPAYGDVLLIEDVSDSNNKKKVTAASLNSGHDHDSRYYTETEINTELDTRRKILHVGASTSTMRYMHLFSLPAYSDGGNLQAVFIRLTSTKVGNPFTETYVIANRNQSTSAIVRFHRVLAGNPNDGLEVWRQTDGTDQIWVKASGYSAVAIEATVEQYAGSPFTIEAPVAPQTTTAPSAGTKTFDSLTSYPINYTRDEVDAALSSIGSGSITMTPTVGTMQNTGSDITYDWLTVLDITGPGYLAWMKALSTSNYNTTEVKVTIDGTLVLDDTTTWAATADAYILGNGSPLYPFPFAFETSLKIECYSWKPYQQKYNYGYQVW